MTDLTYGIVLIQQALNLCKQWDTPPGWEDWQDKAEKWISEVNQELGS